MNETVPPTNGISGNVPQQHQTNSRPIQMETFESFPVNQVQKFDVLLGPISGQQHVNSNDLLISITNPILGLIDKQLDWIQHANKCRVSFRAPVVGIYIVKAELLNSLSNSVQFQAKAYDLSKVFISGSVGKCSVNESYEFSVDASEAGEGQLEIAVNEGEIPNQVQVLDNGKCIVNFVPEESGPHVVDIKFNGHNVNGCPFVVDVQKQNELSDKSSSQIHQQLPIATTTAPVVTILGEPMLVKDERILVNAAAIFSIENFRLDSFDKNDLLIVDPESLPINYKLTEDNIHGKYKFEFLPLVVGDYTVELKQNSQLIRKLPQEMVDQFPFPLKVFDFNKVIVSEVTNGVVDNPIYFFIDASQAGSGNLEIRVSSETRNVPNYPQQEANARIRVNFTPTEAVDHSIDVKFNGIPVPGNPFLVKVAQFPQAKLSISSQELLKYVAIDEFLSFYVDYIGIRPANELTERDCQVHILKPDLVYTKLNTIELKPSEKNDKHMRFKISFRPTKIGPYKLFVTVNNELLPSSPIVSNVYNINEVKVFFETTKNKTTGGNNGKPIGEVNKPVTFTVDASRAGEGTLALAVVSGLSRSPVQTDVKVSDKGHGLYNLTFVPTEFASHSIDMSFNDNMVPNSPFIVEILDENGKSSSSNQSQQQQVAGYISNQLPTKKTEQLNEQRTFDQQASSNSDKENQQQMIQNFEAMSLKHSQTRSILASSSSKPTTTKASSSKKSLAFGLVNASNVVYLESGVLESNKNQVNLLGPNGESVPFIMAKGSPQPGEPKKPYIEYKPEIIGTHTINVLEAGKELRQYFVEICNPSLIRITDLNEAADRFVIGKPITFCIDSRESGEIQLDSITILGPKQKSNGKVRDGDQTILGRIKSMSSSSHSSNQLTPIEYSIDRVTDYKQEVKFIPQIVGKYSVDIRCLGQSVGASPFEIEVRNQGNNQQFNGSTYSPSGANSSSSSNNNAMNSGANKSGNKQSTTMGAGQLKQDELLQSIVVHGISLKCSPVNSTGAFIIETNRLAQAHDFDVVITDPNNSLVDVQCYLQQDGNLLAEWTPKRVGTHKIEVLYKNRQVPGSPFITEAFDPSGVIIENVKNTVYSVNDKIEFKLNRAEAGYGELDVAITSPVGQDLPIDVRPLNDDQKAAGNGDGGGGEVGKIGEIISFTPTVAGKYKISITFGGYEVPKSPITFTARDTSIEHVKVNGPGLRCAEINRSAQFSVESSADGELKFRIECGDREIVPKVEKRANLYTIKYKPTEVGYATISLYWNGAHVEGSPYSVPVNDLSKISFLSGTNKSSNSNNQREIIDYEPGIPKEITVDTSKCGPGDLKAEAYCRANPNIKFSLPINQYVSNRYRLVFTCPPIQQDQISSKGVSVKDFSCEATYLIRFYYNNLIIPETLASVVVSPMQTFATQATSSNGGSRDLSLGRSKSRSMESSSANAHKTIIENNNNNISKAPAEKQVESVKQQQLTSLDQQQRNNNRALDPVVDFPTVVLRGHGLADAKCGEEAEFIIDGTKAGPGKPEVRFNGLSDEVEVCLDRLNEKLYKASYVVQVPGIYSLNVLWDGNQVAGCPISINVVGACDPSKVLCTGDGLKGGILGEEIKTFIDTRRAGPGELTALCTGRNKVAFCELLDRGDGTFVLYIKPQEIGRQTLTIKYGGQHIPRSPFTIKVSGKPDPTRVRVYGPGVEHGVLSLYQSRFVCDTRGAGAGQLTVRIRGPKGAFRMETSREGQKDRTILCKYDPTEPGDYRIEIKWSGRHVPGSPFSVMIFDTQEELNRFLTSGQMNVNKLAAPIIHHQVPYHNSHPHTHPHPHAHPHPHHHQPTMNDYVQFPPPTSNQQQPPFRL